jgi:ketosteroid isomerase-like protein
VSEENVQVARRSFEAFNARDADELVAVSDPDCEWLPFRAQLEGTAYRGHDGVRRFLRDMTEDWTSYRVEPIGFREGGDRVVVTGRVGATGRSGGMDMEFTAGFILELRDGRIVRVRSYDDPAAALAAAGLAESG